MNCVTRLFGFVNKSNNFINSVKYLNDSYFLHQTYLHRCYATEIEKAYKNSSVDVNRSNEKSLTLDDTVEKSNDINLESDKSKLSSELEDVSNYAPAILPSFNFAAYVNNSPSLQEFIKLGVKLYKLEHSKKVAEFLLKLDFEKNVKGHLTFLHDNGVTADQLGEFISANPLIFKEDLDNLQIRINYLLSKRFACEDISRIITKSPKWLSFSTKEIDARLGLFQSEFKLTGNEVRYLAIKQPKLITYKLPEIKINIICLKEDMGFSKLEMKKVLLNKPRLFLSSKNHLLDRFTFVHNVMKINHELISEQPEILTCRLFRMKQRHQFLESLGRAQYDPKEPGYVSLNALISGTDADFCRDVAKTTVSVFNMFLKTQ